MALRQAWHGVAWRQAWRDWQACEHVELWPPIATTAVTMLVLPQSQLMLPPSKPKVKHKNNINNIKMMYQTAYCKHTWCVEAELSSENGQRHSKAFKVGLPGRDKIKRAMREPTKKRRKEEDRLVKTTCLYTRTKDLQCKQDDLERAMAASSGFQQNGSWRHLDTGLIEMSCQRLG
ncbi:hypothetical protein BC827DRAFT_1157462 [Russula dissimulans]|nr:hypothetical protein BC827DRAFT_1157462 [Russula dissimulans]